MKKLLLLLLCVPLIGCSDSDTSNVIEIGYYIGDVDIFEDKRYIQIKNDSTIIRFYNEDVVVYDTSDNGQRILEYKYMEYPHGEIPWEKREWYSNGVLKYELIYYDGKFSPGYMYERKYSEQSELISERCLDFNGEEVGWWYRNHVFLLILLSLVLLPVIVFIAFYRIIRLFICKNHRGLALLLSIVIPFILFNVSHRIFNNNYVSSYFDYTIISFVVIFWIILGFVRVLKKNKSLIIKDKEQNE
ncbi:MAG: hypothetical protein HOA49_01275 [Flavobacteriales bacterium]|jgi:hypothetical protein|nr:hypothetical protein [Flavobacteriales bacterium]MBT4738586.1 hypothetical protein [Flavobacteriales bacterium]MBT5354269.1 hypothetical protein [Flavobacteriales bacterium]MBT5698573.1 hypothetical protein [Flavobacteriales bacterium]MBT6700005.1 hypothetical protein [Flavobacteriales bacterium]